MGNQELPNYKQKQKLLFDKNADPNTLSQWGNRFFKEEWLSDAISFFQKANDQKGLQKIRRHAIEQGDVFLFRRTLDAMNKPPEPDEWKQLGDKAKELGKLQFAREAYRQVGDRKAMEVIDALIQPQQEQDEEDEEDEEDSTDQQDSPI